MIWTSKHSHLIQLNYFVRYWGLSGVQYPPSQLGESDMNQNNYWDSTIQFHETKRGNLHSMPCYSKALNPVPCNKMQELLFLQVHQKCSNFHTSWEKEGFAEKLSCSLVPKKICSPGFMKHVQRTMYALLQLFQTAWFAHHGLHFMSYSSSNSKCHSTGFQVWK